MGGLSDYLDQQDNHRKSKAAPAPRPTRPAKAPHFNVPKPSGGGRFNAGGAISAPPPVHKGGGGFGGFLHSAAHPFVQAEHWTHNKLDLASHDIQAMPAGIYDVGKALVHDTGAALHGKPIVGKGSHGELVPLGKEMGKQTYTSVRHPLRDPFQGLLTATAIASLGAGAAARVGAAGEAASGAGEAGVLGKAGAAAKAAAKKPQMPERILNIPKNSMDARGVVHHGTTEFQLTASQNPLVRSMQHLHDKIVERSLRKEDVGSRDLLRRYSQKRVGKTDAEVIRRTENTASSLPMQIQSYRKFDKGLTKKQGQMALALHSYNVLPHEARNFMVDAIETSAHPQRAAKLADIFDALHEKGVLEVKRGRVVVNKKAYPVLHAASQLTENGAKAREAIIKQYGLMSTDALEARKALPAEVLRSEAARDSRGALPPVPKGHTRFYRGEGENYMSYKKQGLIPGDETHYFTTDRAFAQAHDTGGGLHYLDLPRGIAKDYRSGAGNYEFPGILAQDMKRVPKVEGTGLRRGSYFTSLKLSRKQQAAYPRPASVAGNVIGPTKNFVSKSLHATGEGIRHGLIPEDITGNVARDLKEANTYKAKFEARQRAWDRGSHFSRNHDDILVRNPKRTSRPLSVKTKQELGQELSTLDTVGEDATMKENFLHQFHEFLHPTHAGYVGRPAEQGARWVPRHVVGDLTKSIAPRGTFAKKVDNLNSWITAFTVYAKLSHIPQRVITDATTSLFSGALTSPSRMRFGRMLDSQLSKGDLVDEAQATGTHGYLAIPHEGTGRGGRFATKGANMYARHIDARFRRMNLRHEAMKAGIKTLPEYRKLLAYAKDPTKRIKIADARKYEQVLRRADRTSMMYDGLTATERATLSRAFWFYPWTKAAARYGGHVAMEHPIASAGMIAAGKKGEADQKRFFGGLPTFEYGGIPLAGGKEMSNAGWLTPFNTTGQVVGMGANPMELAGSLNPAVGAMVTAAGGPNSFGETTPGGPGYPSLNAALGELFAPMPEMSILKDYLDSKAAERKTHMFPHSPANDFMTRLIGGPAWPRKYNKKAGHKARARERGQGFDLFIPKK